MKLRYLLGILVCLGLLACESTQTEYLSPGKMQEVLMEIHYADAATERFEAKVQPRNALREDLYDQILVRYGLSREDFFISYKYYVEETFILDSLYGDMIDSFDVKVQRIEDSLSVSKARELEIKRIQKIGDTTKTPAKEIKAIWQKSPKDTEK
ncbi:MAG: DUF4296 domain-containing protein [Bacteroidia bacterium]